MHTVASGHLATQQEQLVIQGVERNTRAKRKTSHGGKTNKQLCKTLLKKPYYRLLPYRMSKARVLKTCSLIAGARR